MSVRFGGIRALEAFSLAVAPREIVSLIGPNGAGKTTLLNAVSGFVRTEGGEILLADRRIDRLRSEERARLGLARTFQTPRLLPSLTVLENVMEGGHVVFSGRLLSAAFGGRSARRAERASRAEAAEILAALKLDGYREAFPRELSYGDQRRCEIARCLALHPRIVLLDEPAAGMNARETEDLGELLLRLKATGLTLLLVDHDMSLVGKVSDRVVALDRGAQIAAGSAREVLRHPSVVRSYLGTA